MISKKNFFIITGGPGVGKTTLIEELRRRRSYNCIPEVARVIIKHQMETNGDALPWMDTKKYSKLMLKYSVEDFIRLSELKDICFFDRGIPDTYGYELLMNFENETELIEAVNEYRYNKTAFILPPWEEIYQTDNERKQDFDVAVDTYHVMKEAYTRSGYELCEVPHLSVENRADFVLDIILNNNH